MTDPEGSADPAGRMDSDADGRPDGSLRERLDGDGPTDTRRDTHAGRHDTATADHDAAPDAYVDRDGDGVPDDQESGGGLRRLKDRLTGRVDEREETVEDRDVPGATPRRP